MRLKADLHIHTNEDPIDKAIEYNSYQLIDTAKDKGYKVIAITNHNVLTYNDELGDYAREKDIVLIPAMEKTIEDCHIVFLNADFKEVLKLQKIKDIKYIKDEKSLVIAPHPFFPLGKSLNANFEKNIEVFDAIEYTSYYFWFINYNKKIGEIAQRYNLPVVGSSDGHFMFQLDSTYTLIDAEPAVDSVISAVKNHRVEIVTKPLPLNFTSLKATLIYLLGSFNAQ